MIRRPPRSTLVRYTTLFQSGELRVAGPPARAGPGEDGTGAQELGVPVDGRAHVLGEVGERGEPAQGHVHDEGASSASTGSGSPGFQSGAVQRWNTRATESRGVCHVSGLNGLT